MKRMKILLYYPYTELFYVLYLTPKEKRIMTDEESEELMDLTEAERIDLVLDGRNIDYDEFLPYRFFVGGNVAIYDEEHQEKPLYIIK